MTTGTPGNRTGWALAAMIGLATAGMPGASAAGDIYALVIGIDRYAHVPHLKGAVNDAVDIAAALGDYEPAELVLLTDRQATRERVLAIWKRFASRARAGDTIVVTFAGHGMNEDAVHPETEPDGRDEVFLMSGFAPEGGAAGQRIRDDEMALLIAGRPDVAHVIVADSSHSGTATRSTQFDLTYRFHDPGGLVEDPLPPPPPPVPGFETEEALSLGNTTFFSAVADAEKAPEVRIGGAVRGALSFAFAEGLRGGADRNRDGTITKGEMEVHVRRFVKSALNGRQQPQVAPVNETERPLFRRAAVAMEDGTGLSRPFEALPRVSLAVTGAPPPDLSMAFDGTDGDGAAGIGLVLDFDAGEIRDANGDRLRQLTREVGADWHRQIQGTIDRMRIVTAVKQSALSEDLEVVFPLGDDLYFEDDRIRISVLGRSHPHVSLFNLSADGQVQWIYPRYAPLDGSGRFDDPETLPPMERLTFDTHVSPPFGAEFLVILQSDRPHDRARRALADFDGSTRLRDFWTELQISADEVPLEVGIHGFFSHEGSP